MATRKQRAAARRNIWKATSAAMRQTLERLPERTRQALGKEAAKARGRRRPARRAA